MKLSILVLSIPSRISLLPELYQRLQTQIGERKDIEVLCLIDNKAMTIGEKRGMLLKCARGAHLAFLDDDDAVSDDYISSLAAVLDLNPNVDVVTFKQHCTVNGKQFFVDFDLRNQNEQAVMDEQGNYRDIKRKPYHMCVWKSVIAKNTPFDNISYGEDLIWVTKLAQRAKTQIKIDKVLHYYQYSDQSSESIQFRSNNG